MKLISNIVFTKNRPLQLNGYLESLYRHLPAEQIRTYVLWKQELFTQEYQMLFSRYPNCTVIRESNFSSDFFKILEKIDTPYILFGIDDVVYFDSVDLDVIDETFNKYNDVFGFSLRFGSNPDLIGNGVDRTEKIVINNQVAYKIRWPEGKTKNTRYPFELCATIYRTELVKKIIQESRSSKRLAAKLFSPSSIVINGLKKIGLARKVLKHVGFFYSPNTLESWVCRWCRNNNDKLPPFIYFQRQCACAVQVNTVNTTTRSTAKKVDEYTIETLNEKYKQGYRLDIDFVANNKPTDTHCDKESFRLVKSSTVWRCRK